MIAFIIFVFSCFIVVIIVNTLRYRSKQIEIFSDSYFDVNKASAIESLSKAIRFQTISYQNKGKFNPHTFHEFHEFLKNTYPNVHSALKLETINNCSLLYEWSGLDSSLDPVLLLAHQDVVPVEPETVNMWSTDAFSGLEKDGYIWGRGTLDDKGCLIAVMEAVEHLLKIKFQPRRTVYLAFGHDEEIGGQEGAAKIAEHLKEKGVTLSFVIDEGMSIIDEKVSPAKAKTALIGLSEKGYITLKIQANAKSGHSSMPHNKTAIGTLAQTIQKLERHPMPPRVSGPALKMFAFLGPEMPFVPKILFANLWLFKSLIKLNMEKANTTNALIRTTCVPTIISGGEKENVVPSLAYVLINFRILPGDTISTVVEHAKKVIDDPAITVSIYKGSFDTNPSPISSINSFGFNIIRNTIREIFKGTIVTPGLVVGATDSRHFAGICENIYRFVPYSFGKNDTDRIHGIDERIATEDYLNMIQFYAKLIQNSNAEK